MDSGKTLFKVLSSEEREAALLRGDEAFPKIQFQDRPNGPALFEFAPGLGVGPDGIAVGKLATAFDLTLEESSALVDHVEA